MQSTKRKLYLSGWLREICSAEYNSSLKLQKFLFLYEAFSKAENDVYEFVSLEGWKNGTVFCSVWNDYTKHRHDFDSAASNCYSEHKNEIDKKRAVICGFIVSVLTEKELSLLTHSYNIWKSKETLIKKKTLHVALSDNDFNSEDIALTKLLASMYPIELVNNSEIISIDGCSFVLSKEDYGKLTDEHYDILAQTAENEELSNPVYVEIDDEGRLIID